MALFQLEHHHHQQRQQQLLLHCWNDVDRIVDQNEIQAKWTFILSSWYTHTHSDDSFFSGSLKSSNSSSCCYHIYRLTVFIMEYIYSSFNVLEKGNHKKKSWSNRLCANECEWIVYIVLYHSIHMMEYKCVWSQSFFFGFSLSFFSLIMISIWLIEL